MPNRNKISFNYRFCLMTAIAARARVLPRSVEVDTFDLGNPCPPVKPGTKPRRDIREQKSQTVLPRREHQTRRGRGARPRYIHADNGTSMTSKTVAQLLSDLHVTKSHSR